MVVVGDIIYVSEVDTIFQISRVYKLSKDIYHINLEFFNPETKTMVEGTIDGFFLEDSLITNRAVLLK